MDEIRAIYHDGAGAGQDEHCTPYGALSRHSDRNLNLTTSVMKEQLGCEKYIYDLDFNYHSMVSEVGLIDPLNGNI